MNNDWTEDVWEDLYYQHKAAYESIVAAQKEQEKFDRRLHEEELYQYGQMISCADELKKFGIYVELPE